jgi:hypothetical protein
MVPELTDTDDAKRGEPGDAPDGLAALGRDRDSGDRSRGGASLAVAPYAGLIGSDRYDFFQGSPALAFAPGIALPEAQAARVIGSRVVLGRS